jgi:hypothetical protein
MLLEKLNRYWQNSPKERVLPSKKGLGSVWFFFQYRQFRIACFLERGPRGGLTEWWLVVDPTREIEIDRFVGSRCSKDENPAEILLPLWEMRRQIKSGSKLMEIYESGFKQVLELVKNDPERFHAILFNDFSSESIPGLINAGLPSLGKR